MYVLQGDISVFSFYKSQAVLPVNLNNAKTRIGNPSLCMQSVTSEMGSFSETLVWAKIKLLKVFLCDILAM